MCVYIIYMIRKSVCLYVSTHKDVYIYSLGVEEPMEAFCRLFSISGIIPCTHFPGMRMCMYI